LDLRSNIRLMPSGVRLGIISVVSVGKNEGKTTVISNLAHAYSKSGDRVLLIDSNLRGHIIPKGLNESTSVGLSDFLQGHAKLEDVIQSKMERLDMIPSGPLLDNPLIFLDSDRMANLIEKVKKRYDLVIIDTPALDMGNDSITISHYCDKVLFVIAPEESSRRKIKKAIVLLERLKIPILGVVLNKTNLHKGRRA
jgi:succinoglycan biosynthesis transport protein ExoP